MTEIKNRTLDCWNNAYRIFGLALLALTFLLLPVSAQAQTQNCPLDGSIFHGTLLTDNPAFPTVSITGSGTTTMSVSLPPGSFGGEWFTSGGVQADNSLGTFNSSVSIVNNTNATVNVSVIPVPKGTITFSASKVDPTQNASFRIIFVTTYGHYLTIDVVLSCPNFVAGCTLTQGYWKNHPEVWAGTSLQLGNRTYTQTELLQIFGTPVRGNGLISLSHQLIAAKLNVASGMTVPAGVTSGISAADTLIGNLVVPNIGNGYLSTNSTRAQAAYLDTFNNGLAPDAPTHCED
jgi:hypothetical protein